jgi:hypothetical protein
MNQATIALNPHQLIILALLRVFPTTTVRKVLSKDEINEHAPGMLDVGLIKKNGGNGPAVYHLSKDGEHLVDHLLTLCNNLPHESKDAGVPSPKEQVAMNGHAVESSATAASTNGLGIAFKDVMVTLKAVHVDLDRELMNNAVSWKEKGRGISELPLFKTLVMVGDAIGKAEQAAA